jgi:hypothetical protein
MTEIFSVSLTSKDSSRAVDRFYKYRGERLPRVGEIINVVRFARGRVIRARVTRVDDMANPPIAASEID